MNALLTREEAFIAYYVGYGHGRPGMGRHASGRLSIAEAQLAKALLCVALPLAMAIPEYNLPPN